MKSITALQGQSIFDIAIQYCGSVDASYAIAKANGLTLDATLLPGQIVLVPEVIDRRIVEELRRRGVGVASRWVGTVIPKPEPYIIKYGYLYNWWATQEQGGYGIVSDDMNGSTGSVAGQL